MKKLISIVLIALMLISVACSEGFDVKSLNDDELSALNKKIQAELFSRHAAGDGIPVPPGQYVVGIDIPAGRYQIIVNEDVMAETIDIYQNSKDKYGKKYWLGSLYGGTTANVNLADENILEITSHTVTIRIFTSLF